MDPDEILRDITRVYRRLVRKVYEEVYEDEWESTVIRPRHYLDGDLDLDEEDIELFLQMLEGEFGLRMNIGELPRWQEMQVQDLIYYIGVRIPKEVRHSYAIEMPSLPTPGMVPYTVSGLDEFLRDRGLLVGSAFTSTPDDLAEFRRIFEKKCVGTAEERLEQAAALFRLSISARC